jgi:hypothetical protein
MKAQGARPNSVNASFWRGLPGFLRERAKRAGQAVAMLRLTANAASRASLGLPKLSALPNAVQ